MPQDTRAPFIEGQFYHIYNRANGDDRLFYTDANYIYFLKKLDTYLSGLLEIYAYCLIPNHFHLLARVRESTTPVRFRHICSTGEEESHKPDRCKITQHFSNFFNCYTKSINRQEHRSGSLFERPFKRKLIDTQEYLKMIILYIHLNPVHHGLTENFESYRWSSYPILIGDQPTKLPREAIYEIFDGKDRFIEDHKYAKLNYLEIAQYILE